MKISNESEIKRRIPKLYLGLLVLFILDVLLAVSPGTIRNYSVLRSFFTGLIDIFEMAYAFLKEHSPVWEQWAMVFIQVVPWLGLILAASLWYRGYSIFRFEKINGFLELENRSVVWELLGIVRLRRTVSIRLPDLISLRLDDRGFRKSLIVLYLNGGSRTRKIFTVSYLKRNERAKLAEAIKSITEEPAQVPIQHSPIPSSFVIGTSNQVHSA